MTSTNNDDKLAMMAQLEFKVEALAASLVKDVLDSVNIWKDKDDASTKIPILTFEGIMKTANGDKDHILVWTGTDPDLKIDFYS